MIGFRFKSSVLTLDIEGEIFKIEMTKDYLNRMNVCAKECNRRADEIKNHGERHDGSAEAILSGIIDELLGEGATDRIFFCREKDLFDLCDVLIYICESFLSSDF